MIYPARRAIVLAAAGAPAAVAAGVAYAPLWVVGLIWIGAVAAAMAFDAALAAFGRDVEVAVDGPSLLGVGGGPSRARFDLTFPPMLAPRRAELRVEADERLAIAPTLRAVALADGRGEATLQVRPLRRGDAALRRLWLRWRGPLGLTWTQVVRPLDRPVLIAPDIAALKDEALRLFSRDALHGAKVQLDAGEGSEFHALREFTPGMDHRAIDWKQSARHSRLYAKERRTERNHTIMLALDAGRAMCEPLDGVTRIDTAINAALLLAYVGLKGGDRVGLFAFDAKPTLSTGATAGVAAFGVLQRMAARIDYSAQETNYTLGLTSLTQDLDRRSLVVVFTEFTDPTGAELMLENLGRLLKRHVVLFVVLRDAELEALAHRAPDLPADVARAVTAAALLRERDLVLARLRRMGVQLVDAPAKGLGPAVVNAYLAIKRRDLL